MGEILGLIAGAVVTLAIFSYLLGDNVLYRWALALLVGCAIGYTTGIAIDYVLREWAPHLLSPTDLTTNLEYIIPLVLGVLLLLKVVPPNRALGKLGTLGNIPLGYLVGVGAGVAVSGALLGTLIPQVLSTGRAITLNAGVLALLQGLVVLIGTIAVLVLFVARPKPQDTGEEKPNNWLNGISQVGRFFLVVGLGAAFAGAISSALSAMVIRIGQLSDLVNWLISSVGG